MIAERIAKALGGRRAGSGWIACCPAHDDHRPSLSISERHGGSVRVKCFAGCDAKDVMARLRALNLSNHGVQHTQTSLSKREHVRPHDRAMTIWKETFNATGTPVELYLRNRGLSLPVPTTLRLHKNLWHRSRASFPAMVALVTNAVTDDPMAVHRTYLNRHGHKAKVDPVKMMLGPTRGGIVRLGQGEDGLLIGEGIETVLSAMQATGRPGWAALSTSGLSSLDLPSRIQHVTILVDGDQAGRKAAEAAANNWSARGIEVRIAQAPARKDFNDMLNATLKDTDARS